MTDDVRPFSFEGLPSVPAVAVVRSRAVARAIASGMGALRSVNARGLGRVALTIEWIDPAPWRAPLVDERGAEAAYTLHRDAGEAAFGTIAVEPYFALSLVRATLGAAAPPVLRPLSPAERGVLAAVIASVLAGCGPRFRVSMDRPPARPADQPASDRVTVGLIVRTATLAGQVQLDLPVTWLPEGTNHLPPEATWQLEIVLAVELGRTHLPGGAWVSAELGDAVVFEGVSAPRHDRPCPCELRIGPHRGRAELLASGQLQLLGPFALGPTSSFSDMSIDDDVTGPGGNEPAADIDAASLLASAPVEIVAEIGRVAMRGDEVMGLTNGAVVPLGSRRRDLVTLRVGGRVWARGELVNVEDQLGVRITELVRPR